MRIATHAAYRDLARRHGLGFHQLPGEPDELLSSDPGQSLLGAGRSPLRNLRHYARIGDEFLDAFVAGSVAASRDADLVIGSIAGFVVGGMHASEKLGIPIVGAFLQPLHPTREFASVLFPQWPWAQELGRRTYNRVSHVALQQLAWQLVRRRIDRARREQLGLGPMSRRGPSREFRRADRLWLYGYSPGLLPKPRDWPTNAHVTGYWFLDREDGWRPPAGLVDFLASGPAPVYVGFGSAGRLRSAESIDIALEALRMTGQRGVVEAPGHELGVRILSDDAVAVTGVPHDWLFPRTSVVAHHVGLGTLETALRAERPSVLVPHYMDEPFWARRLTRLGVSPKPIPRARLTPTRLARRIRSALTDEEMRLRTGRLGQLVGAEQGTARAVASIEAYARPA